MERLHPSVIPPHSLLSSRERPQLVKDHVVEIEALTNIQPNQVGINTDNIGMPVVSENAIFHPDNSSLRGSGGINPIFDMTLSVQKVLDYARKKKPSGRKQEKRKGKLPNHIRHDENAAIAVGTWKKRSKKQTEKSKPSIQ